METFSQLWQYLAEFFLEWETYQIRVLEKIETRLMFENFFSPRKSWRLWDNVEKCGRARKAADDSLIRLLALCVLDK